MLGRPRRRYATSLEQGRLIQIGTAGLTMLYPWVTYKLNLIKIRSINYLKIVFPPNFLVRMLYTSARITNGGQNAQYEFI